MIYLYKRNTGMGRLARELGLSVAFQRATGATQTFEPSRWRRNSLVGSDSLPIGLNWGCGHSAIVTLPSFGTLLNRNISAARSKVTTFERLAEANIPHPRWDRSLGELRHRVGDRSILARLDGQHGGAGIVVLRPSDPILSPDNRVSFYVERLSYQREIRVHVWRGAVIATQVKLISAGNTNLVHSFDQGNAKFTTNLANRLSDAHRDEAQRLAVASVGAVGLDFGAVDLMLTQRNRLYVLEVNSAPGIRSDSIKEAYRTALVPLIRRRGV